MNFKYLKKLNKGGVGMGGGRGVQNVNLSHLAPNVAAILFVKGFELRKGSYAYRNNKLYRKSSPGLDLLNECKVMLEKGQNLY